MSAALQLRSKTADMNSIPKVMNVQVGNVATPWFPMWLIFSIIPMSSPIYSKVFSTAQTTATQLLANINNPEKYEPPEVRP